MRELRGQKCHGPILATQSEYTVIQCEKCGFAHCYPLPPDEAVKKMYEQDYYEECKPEYLKQVEEDRSWRELRYNRRLDMLEGLTGGRRLLEVGSGAGIFLDCARRRGWDVLGIEPSQRAWQYSTQVLGLPVVRGAFHGDLLQAYEKFDCCHLDLVLEHVREPLVILKRIKERLNKGSAICAVVPNDFSPIQKYLHQALDFKAWWINIPQHINYFNHETLGNILSDAGFSIYKVETSFPMEIFPLLGFNYVEDAQIGKKCHRLRVSFEEVLARVGLSELQSDLYAAFAEHGLGRESIVYARG
jgi:SAM-dependent methyltransferase